MTLFGDRRLPFEVREGTPTVTFEAGNVSLMLPWHTLASGRFESRPQVICLEFQEFTVAISGEELTELWDGMRMQEVSRVTISDSTASMEEGRCRITSINVTVPAQPDRDEAPEWS